MAPNSPFWISRRRTSYSKIATMARAEVETSFAHSSASKTHRQQNNLRWPQSASFCLSARQFASAYSPLAQEPSHAGRQTSRRARRHAGRQHRHHSIHRHFILATTIQSPELGLTGTYTCKLRYAPTSARASHNSIHLSTRRQAGSDSGE
ncbi:hypothetical protein BKA81DRAFT_422868 [Phyllosticta paracitricarpa]